MCAHVAQASNHAPVELALHGHVPVVETRDRLIVMHVRDVLPIVGLRCGRRIHIERVDGVPSGPLRIFVPRAA